MKLWHRAPREVYRVYGEDRYLEEETAPEEGTTAQEDTTTAEPDSRAGSSWAAFAAEVPPISPGTAGSASARPSGSHVGRLVGVGLLAGVGLATLVLIFLNMSHRHGVVPEPVGQGTRIAAEQGMERAAGAGRVQVIARGVNSRPAQVAPSSIPPVRTSMRVSGSRPQHRAPAGSGSDMAPREERVWPAERTPGDGASAMAVVGLSTPVAVKPPMQDEFGFEQ